MTDPLQQRQYRLGKTQLEQRIMACHHLGLGATIDQDTAARLGGFAGTNVRQHPKLVDYSFNQHFQRTAGLLATKQAGRNYPGIVEHHQIAGAQILEQIDKLTVSQLAGRPVEAQQPTGAPLGQRMPCDQLIGQVEMKVTETHALRKSGVTWERALW